MKRSKPKPLYESTPERAAKIVAKHLGVYGKPGGWIYNRHGEAICQGWTDYARRLTARRIIGAKEVTDSKGEKVTRYAINWRRLERPL